MSNTIPYVVTKSGDKGDAPHGSIPIAMYGAESGGTVNPAPTKWAEIPDKPTTFAPTIGTTETTAKAGNYTPAWGEVASKPTAFPPSSHADTLVTVAADTASGIVAGNLHQVLIAQGTIIKDLNDRILTLENKP